MSAISLDKLIEVNSSVVASSVNGMTLTSMLMSKNPLIPVNDKQRALPFTSINQVGNFFGVTSEEYKFAAKYFRGYSGQSGMAKLLWIGRYIDADTGAYIRGNKLIPTLTLTALKSIKNGVLTFNFNGESQSVGNLDFSSAPSLSACATIIQTELSKTLTGVTVTYSSLTQAFTAQLLAGDGETTVSYCTDGAVATLLKLTADTLAVLSQGIKSQTPAENWQAMTKITKNWVAGVKLWQIEKSPYEESIADCEWFQAQGGKYCYAPYSDSLAVVLGFKEIVTEANYDLVFVNYSLYDFVASQLGALAAVNYSQRSARISLTNKSYNGIVPLVDEDDLYDLLVAAKINFYGKFASQNDSFNFAEEGWISGIWLYIENYFNDRWVNNQIQIRQALVLQDSKVLPYTDIGYKSISSALNVVGRLCLNNTVAEPNCVIGEEDSQRLNEVAGFDLASALTQQGYYAWVIPATNEERVKRSPVVGYFYYINGGNIGRITINNVFVV